VGFALPGAIDHNAENPNFAPESSYWPWYWLPGPFAFFRARSMTTTIDGFSIEPHTNDTFSFRRLSEPHHEYEYRLVSKRIELIKIVPAAIPHGDRQWTRGASGATPRCGQEVPGPAFPRSSVSLNCRPRGTSTARRPLGQPAGTRRQRRSVPSTAAHSHGTDEGGAGGNGGA
jgi:hypothetical protein